MLGIPPNKWSEIPTDTHLLDRIEAQDPSTVDLRLTKRH